MQLSMSDRLDLMHVHIKQTVLCVWVLCHGLNVALNVPFTVTKK